MRRRARFVRRARCPTCGSDVGVTRAELERGMAQCTCGARMVLDVHDAGGDPHRAMAVVQPRAMLPVPPIARIEERFGSEPTVIIARADDDGNAARPPPGAYLALLALGMGVGSLTDSAWPAVAAVLLSVLIAALYGRFTRETLRLAGDTLHWRRGLLARSVPRGDIDSISVGNAVTVSARDREPLQICDRKHEPSDEVRRWIAQWLREELRR